jgi:hypothetical protein
MRRLTHEQMVTNLLGAAAVEVVPPLLLMIG